MSRRRPLSEEDIALWEAVRHSVTPLKRPRRAKPVAAPLATKPAALAPDVVAEPARPASSAPAAPKRAAASPAPFDTALARKLKRGTVEPVSRIDLHGLRQDEAHAALLGFLRRAQGEGARVALIITGKGGSGAEGEERGVLRRAVPRWLSGAEFRPFVVSVSVAHRGHGGDGALYVHVRKAGKRT
jgi:DNA-nicking Smr family endonuclease